MSSLRLPSSIILACLFVAGGIGTSNPSDIPVAGEKMSINFSTWHLHDSPEVQTVWIPVLQALEEKSGGRISWTLFDGGALGPGPEHYDLVASGRSDMGLRHPHLDARKVPLIRRLIPPCVHRG